VAYGARLESVLGASPRGFESLSLRQVKRMSKETSFLLVERAGLYERDAMLHYVNGVAKKVSGEATNEVREALSLSRF
jgi:hypothetical protein